MANTEPLVAGYVRRQLAPPFEAAAKTILGEFGLLLSSKALENNGNASCEAQPNGMTSMSARHPSVFMIACSTALGSQQERQAHVSMTDLLQFAIVKDNICSRNFRNIDVGKWRHAVQQSNHMRTMPPFLCRLRLARAVVKLLHFLQPFAHTLQVRPGTINMAIKDCNLQSIPSPPCL
jgi:hypothetical protein